jgi:hypothetical protein
MNRFADPGFEQRVADWLEGDPDNAPPIVLGTVLAAFPSIPQRRGLFAPWRFLPMNTFSRAAAAVLVAALALGGAVYLLGRTTPSVGGPTATPKASPSLATAPAPSQLPASALVSITSRQYGYTVSVPRYWGLQPANSMLDGMEPPWVNRETPSLPSAADTAVDFLEGFASDHAGVPMGFFAVAASLTPPGATLGSWTTGTATAVCGSPTSQDAITVDGEAATLSTFAVCDGAHRLWVTVLHGGYAWHINWLDEPGFEAADAVFFEQVLATFRFGEVPATPAPS